MSDKKMVGHTISKNATLWQGKDSMYTVNLICYRQ